jgi:hypothetical protein
MAIRINLTIKKMKRTLLVSMLLGASMWVNAQNVKLGYALGVKAEGNLTTLKTDVNGLSYKMGTGYGLGIFTRVNIGRVYLQPELKYSSQSATSTFATKSGSSTSAKVKFDAIDIPFLLGVKVIKKDDINVRILAGSELSLFSSFKSGDDDLFTPKGSRKESTIRSGMGSIVFGLGMDYKRFTFDVRYKFSTQSVKREIKGIPSTNEVPQQIILSLGFKLLKKED